MPHQQTNPSSLANILIRGSNGSDERRPLREMLYVALLACGLTGLLWIRTRKLTVGSQGFRQVGDDHIYRYMADHAIGTFHIAPWSWRLLVPTLAHYMPMSIQMNFEIIAFLSVALTGIVIFCILRKWEFSIALSCAGLILFFGMSYATKFNIRDFWLTDSTAFLFTALAILALQHRRMVAFATCVFVGTLAKESAIFAVPLCYTFTAERRWDTPALKCTFVCTIPAVMALVSLRFAIPAWNGHATYVASLPGSVRSDIGNVASYNLVTVALKELAARSHVWLVNIIEVFTSFGILGLVLPFIGVRRIGEVTKRFWPFLILVVSQLVFTYNTQRLVVLAFVPIIIASLHGFQFIAERFDTQAWVFIAAASMALGVELVSATASSASPILQMIVLSALGIIIIFGRVYRKSIAWLQRSKIALVFMDQTPDENSSFAARDEIWAPDDGM